MSAGPSRIDIAFLKQFPEFQEFRFGSGSEPPTSPSAADGGPVAATELTPDEQLREGYSRLRQSIAAQLLDRIKQSSPKFFEALV